MSLQRADITGVNKLIKHIGEYEFCRVEVKRGANTVFVKYGDNNEVTEELTEGLQNWMENLAESDPNNATLYKISLSGKSNPEAKGPGTKFLTFDFRLNDPAAIVSQNRQSNAVGDVYLELGELRAINAQLTTENEKLREEIDELQAIIDDQPEADEGKQDVIGEVVEMFKPQIPALLGALVQKFLTPAQPQPAVPLGSIYDMNEIIAKLKQHDPQLEQHLAKLLAIAETNPQQFKMLLNMLGT